MMSGVVHGTKQYRDSVQVIEPNTEPNSELASEI